MEIRRFFAPPFRCVSYDAQEQEMALGSSPNRSPRIAALDGWRGLAILLVLLGHDQLAITGKAHSALQGIGQHGVTIFFVLSGYLITTKLLEPGTTLPRFYIRRFFRLMPVAWAYLGLLAILPVILHSRGRILGYTVSSLLFYRNFIPNGGGYTGHFWSLSMEEQFYMIWPLLLLRLGKRKGLWFAIGGACACAIYRGFTWSRYNAAGLDTVTQVRADALLIGCAMALAMSMPNIAQRIRLALPHAILPALAVLTYCIVRFRWLPPLAESVAAAVLIAASAEIPKSALSKILSLAPLAWLGRISYSVYVWQQPFIGMSNLLTLLIAIPACSSLSYYLIEQPCRRLGIRLSNARREAPEAVVT